MRGVTELEGTPEYRSVGSQAKGPFQRFRSADVLKSVKTECEPVR